ncbi:hypothetical protein BpHYR1_024781 [Brachionus plicatilis]|uniref:Uncharacterized protein n=1 Tax=Brachionus plicatilis TaxID=10195 RepID=A0A3M7S9V5_BRAPC|nr:hypothetical protein BpHYR1_024781 [Brachionus plicatilis]
MLINILNASLPLDIQKIASYISNLNKKEFFAILKFEIKQIGPNIILFISFEWYSIKPLCKMLNNATNMEMPRQAGIERSPSFQSNDQNTIIKINIMLDMFGNF